MGCVESNHRAPVNPYIPWSRGEVNAPGAEERGLLGVQQGLQLLDGDLARLDELGDGSGGDGGSGPGSGLNAALLHLSLDALQTLVGLGSVAAGLHGLVVDGVGVAVLDLQLVVGHLFQSDAHNCAATLSLGNLILELDGLAGLDVMISGVGNLDDAGLGRLLCLGGSGGVTSGELLLSSSGQGGVNGLGIGEINSDVLLVRHDTVLLKKVFYILNLCLR